MHGLLHVRVPLVARRLVTLIPALVILALGFDPTVSLVLSQVVLSFGIPFALIPLVSVTAQAQRARPVREPLGHDGGGHRGIRVPHHAERRAALAGVHGGVTGVQRRADARPPSAGMGPPRVPARNCGTRGGRLVRPGDGAAANPCGSRHPSPDRVYGRSVVERHRPLRRRAVGDAVPGRRHGHDRGVADDRDLAVRRGDELAVDVVVDAGARSFGTWTSSFVVPGRSLNFGSPGVTRVVRIGTFAKSRSLAR